MMGMLALLVLFKAWAPLALVGVLALALAAPLLVDASRWLYWSWVIAYPIMYGFQLGPVLYMLLPLSIPGALLSWVFQFRLHRQLFQSGITLPLLLFLVGLGTNLLHMNTVLKPSWLVRDIATLLVILYMMVLAWQWLRVDYRNKKRLFYGLVAMGLLNGVLIILQKISGIGMMTAGGESVMLRPIGMLSHPNPAGYGTLLALILVIYGYFSADTNKERRIFGLGVLTLLLACLMTMSKTSIVQLIPILGLWTLFLPSAMKWKALISGSVLGLGMCIWLFLIDQGELWETLVLRFSKSDTLSLRQQYWKILIENMGGSSMLMGHGYRSTTQILGLHNYGYGLFQADLNSENGPWIIHPHSAYLKYIYELGLFGFGMFLTYGLMMLRGIVTYIKSVRADNLTIRTRLANLALVNLMMVFLIEGLTEILVLDHLYMLLYFSLATLILALDADWLKPERV
jgi:hypothetical protein